MKAFHRNRLLKLAHFLETDVPQEGFDMSSWVKLVDKTTKNKSCEFVACAIGWATTIPSFRKAGFKLTSSSVESQKCPEFAGDIGYDAVSRFFGIKHGEAVNLFDGHHYNTKAQPPDVATKIRAFIDGAA